MTAFLQCASLVYGTLSLYYVFCVHHNTKSGHLLKLLFRTLPLVVLAALMIFVDWCIDPEVEDEQISKFYFIKLSKSLWALLFFSLSEVYLYFNMIPYKQISLTLAYSFLIFVFSFDGFLFYYVGIAEVISLHLIGSVPVAVLIYTLPKFKCVQAILVFVQACVVTIMLWCSVAAVQLQPVSTPPTILSAVGAAVFYVSDLVTFLTTCRGGLTRPLIDLFVTVAYFVALYIVILSVIVI